MSDYMDDYPPAPTAQPNRLLQLLQSAGAAVRDYGPKGSAAMAERGPWIKDAMIRAGVPKEVPDFLGQAITQAPMGFGSRGGAVKGADAVNANWLNRPTQPGDRPSIIMNPRVNAEMVSRMAEPNSIRDYSTPDRSNGMVAHPEDVGFWARQAPANSNLSPPAKPPVRAYDPYFAKMLRESEGHDPLTPVEMPKRPGTFEDMLNNFRRDNPYEAEQNTQSLRDSFRLVPGGKKD